MALAIKRLDSSRPDLFVYEMDGHLTSQDVTELYGTLEKAYADHDKVDLVVKLTNLDGWDWSAAFTETTWVGKTHALKHIRRYAVVGAPVWMKTVIAVFDPLFSMEMRCFDADEMELALAWADKGHDDGAASTTA